MSLLPEVIPCGAMSLCRWKPADRAELQRAVDEAIDSIRAWMPSAATELADLDTYFDLVGQAFEDASVFAYALFLGDRTAVGHVSIQAREPVGEIGYWVRPSAAGHGHATAAVDALTDSAFANLGHLTRIEIHCDAANGASARVAEKAGYVHARTEYRPPRTSSQSGSELVWIKPRPLVER